MTEQEFQSRNGWKFSVSKQGRFLVVPTQADLIHQPNYLFKYYALNDNSVDALLKHYFFGPQPEHLNDPLDCSYELLKFDNKEFLFELMNPGRYANPEYPMELIRSEIRNEYSELIKGAKNLFKDLVFGNLGILSMTEVPDNELMWSYYSNHSGFCLEFDHSEFGPKFRGPFPINYHDEFDPISVTHLSQLVSVLYMTTLKSTNWCHEKEWRFLLLSDEKLEMPMVDRRPHRKAIPRKFYYNSKSIKSITLGANFFSKEFEWKNDPINPTTVNIKDSSRVNSRVQLCLRSELIDYIIESGTPVFMMIVSLKQAKILRKPIALSRVSRHEFQFQVLELT